VQFGFVIGALLIAITNVADMFSASRLFALSALFAAACNALFAYVAVEHRSTAIALRFLTGAALAGVYPVGMKLISSWFREGRGFALGALVGALTLGKASPHLIGGVQAIFAHEIPWRAVTLTSSVLALIAAVIVWKWVHVGPYHAPPVKFRVSAFAEFLRNPPLLLANLGYLGHMWELYSMWGWIAVILAASRAAVGLPVNPVVREVSAFGAIAAGAIGCFWAGKLADGFAAASKSARIRSRARVAIVAMVVSGVCSVAAAFAFHNYAVLVAISLVWGVSVVADSAQFSAIISDVSDQSFVGTALTIQTAMGFLLTTVSIKFAADIAAAHGWPRAMMVLAIGPALGIVAMIPHAVRAD
jgi:MFS family permease